MIRKIFQLIRLILRYLKRQITLIRIVSIVNVGVAIAILFLAFTFNRTVIDFGSRMDVFHSYFKREYEALSTTIIDLGNIVIENDLSQVTMVKDVNIITKGIQDNINRIIDIQKKLKERMALAKLIKIENIDKLKKANLLIINATEKIHVSGSYIKIGNKNYILTCAHVLHNIEDYIGTIIDNKIILLELIKADKKKDLALFEILTPMKDFPYLEISNEYPTEGSETIVISNPSGLEDVISDGIIAKERKKHYVFTNKIYFGSSGGALLYKGKIIGIISYIQALYDSPYFVNYGVAVKLKVIKEFLKDIK